MATDLERELVAAGVLVLGPVPNVDKVLALTTSEPATDAVVLDIDLGGAMFFLIADALLASGIPMVILTGFGIATWTTASPPSRDVTSRLRSMFWSKRCVRSRSFPERSSEQRFKDSWSSSASPCQSQHS